MRSGRMRRLLISSSRCRTAPWPSRLGGRVSSRATCGCFSCSSAASSMVTMRSFGRDEGRERVEQRRLAGAGAARDDDVQPRLDGRFEQFHHARRHAPCAPPGPAASACRCEKRRIDSSGPSTASGGMMAFTREPSLSRASTIGRRFVDAPAHLRDDLVDDAQQVRSRRGRSRWSARAAPCARRRPAWCVFTRMSEIGRVVQQRLERPQPEDLVEHLVA